MERKERKRRGQLESKRLKAERKGCGKRKRRKQSWGVRERGSGGKTRTMSVFVSSLSLWHFGGQRGFVCVCVCVVFASPSTQFVELIRSLIVSKTKSQPNPTIIYNTDGGAERPREII